MTLVVIVCAYRAFVGKASIRRIDKTNVVAQFENGMTLVLIVINRPPAPGQYVLSCPFSGSESLVFPDLLYSVIFLCRGTLLTGLISVCLLSSLCGKSTYIALISAGHNLT